MILAASILSADFGCLAQEVQRAERGGAGVIHVDVMDGHFVPNITVGPLVVEAVRRATGLPIDVHLMIEQADRYIEAFANAGASWISVHVEAVTHLQRTVARLRELGVRPGVVLNPATPLTALEEILPELDYTLLMTVNPGFAGQSFMADVMPKLRRIAEVKRRQGLDMLIEVDGGVSVKTAPTVATNGGEVLVAGSAVFCADDPATAVGAIRDAAEGARL